jgi:hypothetical protein
MNFLFSRLPLLLAAMFVFRCPVAAQPESWSHGELRWYTIRTEHFDVHFHDNPYTVVDSFLTGPERTARLVARIAEEVYGPITILYNYKPERVHFVIRDTDDYSNGGAYYYDNKIEIWASNLDFELRGTHNWLRNVVTHEFAHMVSIQAMMKFSRKIPGVYLQYIGYEKERRQDVLRGFPNVVASYPLAGVVLPIWFAEGVAQYQQKDLDYEFWDSHRDMILRSRALSNRMLTLSEMSTFGKNSIGNESAYNSGYGFVSFLAARYGEEVLEQMCRHSRSMFTTFEGAVEKAVGKDLHALYDEWTTQLASSYERHTSGIRNHLVEGSPLIAEGTGNFSPSLSPDGKRVAYISNEGNDYLSQTALFLCDVSSGLREKVVDRVEGSVDWSPDGRSLVYAKNLSSNPYGSQVNDIYLLDVQTRREYRLTRSLRAFSPAFTPDGRALIAVTNNDGTNNLIRIDSIPSDPQSLASRFPERGFVRKGLTWRRITHFRDGRQIYRLAVHPTEGTIVFDTSTDDGRDIARVEMDGSDLSFICQGVFDERSPALSRDGRFVYYASDQTGIFNIYQLDLRSGDARLLTNVTGGAFYPTVDSAGNLAFSLYKEVGFILSYVPMPAAIDPSVARYSTANPNVVPPVVSSSDSVGRPFAKPFYPTRWPVKTKSYAGGDAPSVDSLSPYRTRFLDFAILPLVRMDYGTIKPGFYFYSGDVLGKSSLFGGWMFNLTDFDRDLFAVYEYSGMGPTLFLELYNVTRSKTFRDDADPGNEIKYESIITNDFELREADAGVDLSLFFPRDLRLMFAHSEYYVKISGREFRNGVFQRIPRTGGIKYFYGNDVSVNWKQSTLRPAVDGEINPRGGRKLNFRYSYNLDNLIRGFAFNTSTGATDELYEKGYHHRLEAHWTEFVRVPVCDHTLEVSLQGGIIPTKVDSFYNFFGGGLPGLKGYSYYSLEGSRMTLVTATYRFPLWRRIDRQIGYLYADKIFGGLYFGYGNVWSGKTSYATLEDFKKDIGFEIRMEFYSFYVYPTRITFDAVYGLDKFYSRGPVVSTLDPFGNVIRANQQVENGNEWRYYLTVLFGFTLFD